MHGVLTCVHTCVVYTAFVIIARAKKTKRVRKEATVYGMQLLMNDWEQNRDENTTTSANYERDTTLAGNVGLVAVLDNAGTCVPIQVLVDSVLFAYDGLHVMRVRGRSSRRS